MDPGGGQSVARSCTLCGRPLTGAAGEQEHPDGSKPDEAFCCAGCARVHAVLAGLDDDAGQAYLDAARALGIVPAADAETPASDPDVSSAPQGDPAAEREERFRVEGFFCPSCAWVVERVLEAQPGVGAARVDFFSASGTVRLDLRRTSLDQLGQALVPFGYRLRGVEDEQQGRVSRGVTFSFVVAATLTMNLMSLAAIRYAHDVGWLASVPPFLPWVELALCLPVLYLGWLPALRRAWLGLARRRVTMDFLIGTSVGAAFLLSCAALATGRQQIYFETAAGLVTIALLSRMIEARLRERAFRDTAAVMRLGIAWARLEGPDGQERYRPLEEVQPGEVVVVRAGEVVAFDGELTAGEAHVSEAVLTGEPEPLRKVVGDRVVAGATVVQGPARLRVIRRWKETRLHAIAEGLRQGLVRSEGRLRSADAVAAWFSPLVIALALGAWLWRLATLGASHALDAEGWFPSVAMLAVACPCAFSLAGVAAITAATGALLRRGLLVRDPIQLEQLHRIDTICFDKTGTLSEGRLSVEQLAWRDEPRPELLGPLLAAEMGATHPVAQAIRGHLLEQGVAPVSVDAAAIQDLPGQGRRLTVEGRTFQAGAAALFRAPFAPSGVQSWHTLVWFGWEEEATGCLVLADKLRPGAREAVQALGASGRRRLEILSGDRQQVSDWVAREVGAHAALGDVTLERKVELVSQREGQGEHIAFVGDGTNDALAMSQAAASVAIAGATDEALTAAGFVMLHGRLAALVDLFATGERLWRVIRGNYLWAFGFNALFLPVAAAGLLAPLAAMVLMLASSSAVLLNSLRLRR